MEHQENGIGGAGGETHVCMDYGVGVSLCPIDIGLFAPHPYFYSNQETYVRRVVKNTCGNPQPTSEAHRDSQHLQ